MRSIHVLGYLLGAPNLLPWQRTSPSFEKWAINTAPRAMVEEETLTDNSPGVKARKTDNSRRCSSRPGVLRTPRLQSKKDQEYHLIGSAQPTTMIIHAFGLLANTDSREESYFVQSVFIQSSIETMAWVPLLIWLQFYKKGSNSMKFLV